MSAVMPLLDVKVDVMSAQGAGNLALELVPVQGDHLPAFDAGAHVDVHLPNGLVRQYSIASAPAETSRYVLCVRREAASRGGSAFVHERLRVGDRLKISSPRNLFALQSGQHHVLVAGGIGITPLLAMAHHLRAQSDTFELHYYARSRNEIAFRRVLDDMGQGVVHVHCADEGRDARHVLPEILERGDASHHLYLCGPAAFMEHVSAAALARGWRKDNIHSEAFTPAAVVAAPGAAEDSAFEVELASTGQVFNIAPGKTIASVLSEAGIGISLSCEMGMCGACLVDVISGAPDHRDTVQSDQEKSSNRQMTLCCSRSHSPRLKLAL